MPDYEVLEGREKLRVYLLGHNQRSPDRNYNCVLQIFWHKCIFR